MSKIKKFITYMLIISVIIPVASIAGIKKVHAAMTPDKVTEIADYIYEEYVLNQSIDNVYMSPYSTKVSEKSYNVDLENVHAIFLSATSGENPCCESNYSGTQFVTLTTVSGANTYEGNTYCEIKDNGVGWGIGTITLSQQLTTYAACSKCGKIAYFRGDNARVTVERRCPRIVTQPENAKAYVDGEVILTTLAKYAKSYKWQVEHNGSFVDITDGYGFYGAEYAGSNTDILTIKPKGMSSPIKYRCVINGVASSVRYTDTVMLEVLEKTSTPTPEPTKEPTIEITPIPTPEPTAVPSPMPTVVPSPTPTGIVTPVPTKTPTPIIPTPTIEPTKAPPTPSINQPSSSSSSFVIPTPTAIPVITSSSSSKTSTPPTSSSAKEGNLYREDSSSSSSSLPGITGGSTKKEPKSNKEYGNKPSVSRVNSSTSKSSIKNTIMKNGILYIIDEEDENGRNSLDKNDGEDVQEEQFLLENEYSENDLMETEEVMSLDKDNEMEWVMYLWIVLAFIIGLLMILFLLFFGVIVEGECEEHDEVFDLVALRIVYRKEGKWHVNLGEAFEDNAVVRLRLGLIFVIVFKDFEIECSVSGTNEGSVNGEIEQKMLLYRKRIRRRQNV